MTEQVFIGYVLENINNIVSDTYLSDTILYQTCFIFWIVIRIWFRISRLGTVVVRTANNRSNAREETGGGAHST